MAHILPSGTRHGGCVFVRDWWGGFQWLITHVFSCARTHTHCTVQSLLCDPNEGLGTLHVGLGERTSVAVLAWLSESNVVTPFITPLRACFSTVAPSVPFLSMKVPAALLLHMEYVKPFTLVYREEGEFSHKLSGVLFCEMAYFIINKHIHYAFIRFFNQA